MTQEQFIKEIAKYVAKYAPQYNIKVHSPIIAQAILESASGTSELAVNANNYFGLKYRPNRCPSANGIYYKVGSEQNADGSYTSSAMQWMKFNNMEDGVKGYFDFTNISNYQSLKGVTDPETYLKNIKAAGYATSLKYVNNLMAVIKKYNLTQYDSSTPIPSTKVKLVGLDRGHGLKTGGKETPDKIKEWTLNDAVADKVVELLVGYNVEFIHTDNDEGNVDESLASRRTMYVNQKVDAFVSIHHNAHTGTWNNATGVEIYTDNNPTSQDTALANAIYKNLPNYTGLRGRGIKKANFAVINQNSIPAVLVEGGFMDSNIDYKVITSKDGQLGYARAVAEGLIEFLGLVKTGTTPTPAPTPTPPLSSTVKNVVRVNTTLNVRNKPNGTIVDKLANGAEVKIIDYQNNWFKIGTDRWISATYVRNTIGTVTANTLNIRSGAGTSYTDIGDLKHNEKVRLLQELNGWYLVLSESGKFGWCSGKYLQIN